jgi:hypothetical protein
MDDDVRRSGFVACSRTRSLVTKYKEAGAAVSSRLVLLGMHLIVGGVLIIGLPGRWTHQAALERRTAR